MSIVSKPNTFSANTTASASDVNDNFDTLYNDYNGSIAAANLATNAVSTAKIADSAVTTAKLNAGAVTLAKLESNLATGWMDTGESWTYTSFATTVGTITVPSDATTKYSAGMKIRISQSTGGTKYGIITKVAATLLTVYFGTDYTLNNETISSPYFSVYRAPFGFPLDTTKWTVTTTSTSNCSKTSPAQNTWYGDTGLSATGPNISVPIGVWELGWSADIQGTKGAVTSYDVAGTLSTASNSQSDAEFTAYISWNGASGTVGGFASVTRKKYVAITSTTTYYLNVSTDIATSGTIGIRGDTQTIIIRAICAYL